MTSCPRSSVIHKQKHSHLDLHQLAHFACLFQLPNNDVNKHVVDVSKHMMKERNI